MNLTTVAKYGALAALVLLAFTVGSGSVSATSARRGSGGSTSRSWGRR